MKVAADAGHLTHEAYSPLLDIVPAMLEWLRDRNLLGAAVTMKNAAMFLVDPKLCPKIKPAALSDIFNNLAAEVDKGPIARATRNRCNNVLSPSNFSLRFFMVTKSTDITLWYVVILKILSNPPIIPKSVLQLEIATNLELSSHTHKEQLGMLNTLLIRDFSTRALLAFAELCSILRDSLSLSGGSEFLRTTASTIARVLLGKDTKNGCHIMQVCIKRCYSLFQFLPQKNANWKVHGYRTKLPIGNDAVMVKRLIFDKLRKDLITFYELKDSTYIPSVHLLMISYSIYELALGLVVRYGCLPLGWREFLMKGRGRKELDWFSDNLVYVSQDVVVTKKKFYIPGKARKRFEHLKTNTLKDELNRIVDELIQKKIEYVSCLQAFLNEFVSEIKFIAENETFGAGARSALGIDSEYIEKLMGGTLKAVLNVEERVLADLESLRLVPCEVKQEYRRAGLLCRILLKHREETVKAYTSYGKGYDIWEDTLKTLLKDANRAQIEQSIHLHFVGVYTELRRTNPILGTSIDVILQNPIGYLTKIPLYLERMKKHIEKKLAAKHPSYKIISESLLRFRELVQEVNKGIGEKQGSLEASSKSPRKVNRNRTATNTSSFLAFSPSRRKTKRNKGLNISAGSLQGT